VLTAVPISWYSWNFRVVDNGSEIAEVRRQGLGGRWRFRLDGGSFEIARRGLLGAYELHAGDGRTLARSERTGVLGRAFQVTALDRVLTLRPDGVIGRNFSLLHGDLNVGRLRRPSLWKRTMEIGFPPDLPLELRIFLVFLVFTVWRRRQRAAASG
jgi:hypothetical protein